MKHRALIAVLLCLTAAGRAAADDPPALKEMRERLQRGPRDRSLLVLGDRAIAEARENGDDEALRDALIATTNVAMQVEGFQAGMKVLDQPWPAAAGARALLHVIAAAALLEHGRPPQPKGGTPTLGSLPDALETLRLDRLAADRRAAAARHLDAAWALRVLLPQSPEQAFGPHYRPVQGSPRLEETSRDSMTAFIASLLVGRESWAPADTLGCPPATSLLGPAPLSPGDLDSHPLLRAAAVLGDLERWHAEAGRRAEALGAARRGAAILLPATCTPDRAVLIERLEQRARADHDLSASPSALADVVELMFGHVASSGAESWLRTMQLARECASLPDSPGSERCRWLLERQRPRVEITGMSHDGAGQRSIQLRTSGLDEVHLEARRIEGEAAVALLGAMSDGVEAMRTLIDSVEPVARWTERPYDPRDGLLHSTLVAPPLARAGVYLITASPAFGQSSCTELLAGLPLVITDLALMAADEETDGTRVTVVNAVDGTPQRGVVVERVSATGEQAFARAVTDRHGLARLPAAPDPLATMIVARRGDNLAATEPRWPPARHDHPATMLFAERARYRPGERVRFFYLAARESAPGRMMLDAGRRIAVTLYDPTGTAVRRLRPTTSAFGAASGALTIASGHPAGRWRIEADDGAEEWFDVFDDGGLTVDIEHAPAEPRPGDRLLVSGRLANGRAPVGADAEVHVALIARTGVVDATRATLDRDLSFTGELRVPERCADSTLTLEAIARSGEFASQAARTVSLAEHRLRLHLDDHVLWLPAGADLRIAAERRIDDRPAPGLSRFRVTRLDTEALARELAPPRPGWTEADRRRARFDRSSAPALWTTPLVGQLELAAGELRHGSDGLAETRLLAPPEGLYEIQVETEDERGAPAGDAHRLIVLGAGARVPFQAGALLLPATGPAPDEWAALAHSGFRGQRFLLEHFLDGRLLSAREIKGTHVERRRIDCAAAGRHDVRLSFVRDYEWFAPDLTLFTWCSEPRVVIEAARDDAGLRLAVARDGRRLREGEAELLVVFPPAPGGADAHERAPEPHVLDRRLDPPARVCSLGTRKGTNLGQPPPQLGRPEPEPAAGYIARLFTHGARDAEAERAQSEAHQAASVAVTVENETDRRTFQPHLQPDRDGVVRVELPSDSAVHRVWVVALDHEAGHVFTEFELTADGAVVPSARKGR